MQGRVSRSYTEPAQHLALEDERQHACLTYGQKYSEVQSVTEVACKEHAYCIRAQEGQVNLSKQRLWHNKAQYEASATWNWWLLLHAEGVLNARSAVST